MRKRKYEGKKEKTRAKEMACIMGTIEKGTLCDVNSEFEGDALMSE